MPRPATSSSRVFSSVFLLVMMAVGISGLGLTAFAAESAKKPAPKAATSKTPRPAAKPAGKPAQKPAPKAKTASAPAKRQTPRVGKPLVKPAPRKGTAKGPDAKLLRKGVKIAPSPEPETTSQPLNLPISTICVDADSGVIISESNADVQRPPASMIKLMLMLLVTEGLEAGKWKLDTPITVSARSQGMGGTQVLLKAGDVFPLDHLMHAVAVASANDAAMAVAEGLWGSEADYLKAANARAAELGMTKTVIHGVHGLPPGKGEEFDQTCARDMSLLGRMCVTKPQIMEWVGSRDFQLTESSAVHASTNKLLARMPDCDGLKTGFIRAAGFCITATAKRGDTRLICVVMGHPSKYGRFNDAEKLLEEGFNNFRKVRLVAKGDPVDSPILAEGCNNLMIKLVAQEELWVKMKLSDMPNIKYSAVLPDKITPPVASGAPLGKLILRLDGQQIGEVPLVLPDDLSMCGWVQQGTPPMWGPPAAAKPEKRGGFFRGRM